MFQELIKLFDWKIFVMERRVASWIIFPYIFPMFLMFLRKFFSDFGLKKYTILGSVKKKQTFDMGSETINTWKDF